MEEISNKKIYIVVCKNEKGEWEIAKDPLGELRVYTHREYAYATRATFKGDCYVVEYSPTCGPKAVEEWADEYERSKGWQPKQ